MQSKKIGQEAKRSKVKDNQCCIQALEVSLVDQEDQRVGWESDRPNMHHVKNTLRLQPGLRTAIRQVTTLCNVSEAAGGDDASLW